MGVEIMNTWLWWQSMLEIGAVKSVKSIENILCNSTMTDDQSLTCLEILFN